MTDTARGFIALAETPGIEGMEINIATGREVTMQHTLELIAKLMEADVTYEVDPQRLRPSKSEVRRLCGDNRLIENLTPWRPGVTLEQGLKKTIDWFTQKENLAKYKDGYAI